MPATAQLTLNGHHYDIELLNQSFYLSTDWNDHPRNALPGDGRLCIQMNTPTDNFILELMMKTEETPLAEGQLEIYDAKSDMPARQIKLSKTYITEFRETFNLLDDDRTTTYMKVSPIEMTINKGIKIERRPFWLWSKALQEPMKMAEVVTDTGVHLNGAYWIKPDGEKCKEFPIGEVVKLYLVLGNYNVEQAVQFDFEEEINEGVCRASYSGETNDNGMIIIEDFEFKRKE